MSDEAQKIHAIGDAIHEAVMLWMAVEHPDTYKDVSRREESERESEAGSNLPTDVVDMNAALERIMAQMNDAAKHPAKVAVRTKSA